MREIKYKIWDSGFKKFINPKEVVICADTGRARGVRGGPGFVDHWHLLEYTGLKDRNGKEVYEGDIFKCYGEVFRVEYINEYMAFCPFTEEQWGWFKNGSNHFKYCFDEDRRAGKRHFLSMYEPYEIEVIGNIHENPELIGAEE